MAVIDFMKEVDKIIARDKKYSFGNDILYDMCDPLHGWGTDFRLASKLWIIGRTYAASIERRYHWNKATLINGKDPTISHGNGTEDFFADIAKILTSHPKWSTMIARVTALRSKRFQFNKSPADQLLLKEVVECVIDLNLLIYDVTVSYDQNFNQTAFPHMEHKQHLSFSSKFLHFHAPHTVFIFDGFTEKNGKAWVNGKKDFSFDDCLLSFLENIRNCVKTNKTITDRYENKEVLNLANRYYKHCVIEYLLCCFIKDNKSLLSDTPAYFPRLADSILLRL